MDCGSDWIDTFSVFAIPIRIGIDRPKDEGGLMRSCVEGSCQALLVLCARTGCLRIKAQEMFPAFLDTTLEHQSVAVGGKVALLIGAVEATGE